MSKHQFIIGSGASARTLNFEGSKIQATEAAEKWQAAHPEHTGVQFVKTVKTKKNVFSTRNLHKNL